MRLSEDFELKTYFNETLLDKIDFSSPDEFSDFLQNTCDENCNENTKNRKNKNMYHHQIIAAKITIFKTVRYRMDLRSLDPVLLIWCPP